MKANSHKTAGVLMGVVLFIDMPSVVRANELQKAAPFPTEATTPDKRELLGGWLEDRFQKMVASCTGNPVGAIQLKSRSPFGATSGPVSVVPIQVQNFYDLKRDTKVASDENRITGVYSLGSQSLNSLFSRVETFDEPKAGIDHNLTPAISLNLSNLPSDLNAPLAQFNGAGYSMSCANSFSFAYKFDASYKVLPAGAIAAALDGGASAASNNNLRLSAGVFYSPYVAMWTGKHAIYDAGTLSRTGTQAYGLDESAALKTLAGVLFWQWYLDHADKADQKNYIIEYFSGVAAIEEQVASSKDSTRAKLSAGLTVPVVSAGIKAEFDSRRQTDFWSSTFDLAAYRDGRSKHAGSAYYLLPSPAIISEELKSITLKPSSIEPLVLNTDGSTEFYQDAYGLVQPSCDWGWNIQADKTPRLSLTSKGPDRDALGIPVCRFKLSFTPNAAERRRGAQIEFDVVSTRQVTTTSGKVSFTLKGARQWARPPAVGGWNRLSLGSQTPVDETGLPLSAASRKAIWKFDFQFDPGERGMATPNYLAFSEGSNVVCDGSRDPLTVITPRLSTKNDIGGGLGFVLTVTFEAGIPVGAPLTAPADASVCRFSGTLRFSPPGGPIVVDPEAFSSLPLVYPLLPNKP